LSSFAFKILLEEEKKFFHPDAIEALLPLSLLSTFFPRILPFHPSEREREKTKEFLPFENPNCSFHGCRRRRARSSEIRKKERKRKQSEMVRQVADDLAFF
jgi:hypothetical protein